MAEVYGRQPTGSSRPTCRNCGKPAHAGRCSMRIDYERAQDNLEVEQTASLEVHEPTIPARTLAAFAMTLPVDAAVTVSPMMGGSQRDPEVVGYRIRARWTR